MSFRFKSELELLTCLARVQLSDQARDRAERLFSSGSLKAHKVLSLALYHRVFPQLNRHLKEIDATFPEAVREALRDRVRSWAMHGLTRRQSLLQILTLLREHDIPALSFKGSILGTLVYGDVGLRPFGDLDIWAPPEDMHRVRVLLVNEGFQSVSSEAPDEDTLVHRMEDEKSYELVHGDTVVELHWEFLHPMHGRFMDPKQVWARAVETEINGQAVRTLSAEDRVLYLCAHGSKHYWDRLGFVCDVAESLQTHQREIDWSLLFHRAQELRAERMLHIGLQLAGDLLDEPLPSDVRQELQQDKASTQLADQVQRDRLAGKRTSYDLTREDAQFHLQLREDPRDRWPYYRQLLRLALTPTEKDRAWLPLPSSLNAAYYLIRPFRLLSDSASSWLHRSST